MRYRYTHCPPPARRPRKRLLGPSLRAEALDAFSGQAKLLEADIPLMALAAVLVGQDKPLVTLPTCLSALMLKDDMV